MPDLKLSLLGPPQIALDGAPVHVSRHKAVALLAYLALSGQTHRRDALAALLWPEHDQSGARAGLRRALAALREALGDGWLDADRDSIGLNRDAPIELDVRAFRGRLAGCQQHSGSVQEGCEAQEACAACLSRLAEAADLYGGDFLAGFTLHDSAAFDDWQFFQTQGLRDELANALAHLADGHGARGEFEQAIAYARRWLALDSLHEPAHRRLIELYARSGQRAAALRQYEQCVQILEEELGVPPEEETTALYRAIVEHLELPSPVSRNQVSTHNLPAQVTPFIGREAVLNEIGERLADPDCRLLTLVGPGGSGKTRLALEAAARRLDDYPHGVFLAPLAPVDALEGIVPAIAQALGFSFYGEGEPKAQLLAYLRDKQMLLILDNYEHLLEGAGLAIDVLEAAPQVTVMVTSRTRLSVRGEHRLAIEGLDFPGQEIGEAQLSSVDGRPALQDALQFSAVKLFLDGARRAQADLTLSDDTLADVVRICRLVEGMPLGILLAAAWAGTLTPGEIAAEIEQSLDFLEADWRDAPARQRSMRAVFDHSWALLSARQHEVGAALSVFRGGFTREAAERVVGASLRDLTALVDRSLLHRTPGGRYEVHELVRQYAAEKLAAADKLAESRDVEQQVRERHSAFYAAALERWNEALKGARQLEALAEIEADLGNARAAWEWAVAQGQVQELDRAMDGLCRFYEWRVRYEEGDAACHAAAEALEAMNHASTADEGALNAAETVWARAMAWRGVFHRGLRRLERAQELLEESLARLEALVSVGQDVRREQAFALWQLGYTLYDLGAPETRQRYEQSLALYRALGDRWGMASVSYHLGDLLQISGVYEEAEALVREGLATQQDLGDRRGMAGSLRILSLITLAAGPFEESERLVQESVAIFRSMGDRAHAAEALLDWGWVLVFRGDLAQARSRLEEGVAIYRDLGFSGSSSSISLAMLGCVDMFLGRYEEARVSAQAALAMAQERAYRLGIGTSLSGLSHVANAEGEYAQAQQLARQACPMLEGSVFYSTALVQLAYAARGLGQLGQARRHICELLRIGPEVRNLAMHLGLVLPAVALILADQGAVERAVELYALASCYPLVANAQWYEDVAGKHIAAAAKALPPEGVAAAKERGRVRDLDATVKELLVELEAKMQDEEGADEN